MCAVCFTAAEMVPAVAAAGRAMFVRRTMRKAVVAAAEDLTQAAAAPPAAAPPAEAQPAEPGPAVLSSV